LRDKGHDEDRVKKFQRGATDLIIQVITNFNKFKIYTGKSCDASAGLAFFYIKDIKYSDEEPTWLIFNDGCIKTMI